MGRYVASIQPLDDYRLKVLFENGERRAGTDYRDVVRSRFDASLRVLGRQSRSASTT